MRFLRGSELELRWQGEECAKERGEGEGVGWSLKQENSNRGKLIKEGGQEDGRVK